MRNMAYRLHYIAIVGQKYAKDLLCTEDMNDNNNNNNNNNSNNNLASVLAGTWATSKSLALTIDHHNLTMRASSKIGAYLFLQHHHVDLCLTERARLATIDPIGGGSSTARSTNTSRAFTSRFACGFVCGWCRVGAWGTNYKCRGSAWGTNCYNTTRAVC